MTAESQAVFLNAVPLLALAALGAAAGLAIAALDLGLVGRRFARLRALPILPQVGDHVAYGAIVAAVLTRRRSRR